MVGRMRLLATQGISGHLCSNFRESGHVPVRTLHSHEVGHVILVIVFTTPHVNKVRQNPRVNPGKSSFHFLATNFTTQVLLYY